MFAFSWLSAVCVPSVRRNGATPYLQDKRLLTCR